MAKKKSSICLSCGHDFDEEYFEFDVEEIEGNNVPEQPNSLCFECLCDQCNCSENKIERLQCNSNGAMILMDKSADDALIISSLSNHFRQHSQFLLYNGYTDIAWGHLEQKINENRLRQ